MKTYSDLTDGTLKRLHCLAHKMTYVPIETRVERTANGFVNVESHRFFTAFDNNTGDINAFELSHQAGINNLWQIIKECQEHGLHY